MLYFVGLGLKPAHISEEALRAARSCRERILDGYTTPVPEDFVKAMEERIGEVRVAGRKELEEGAVEIVRRAQKRDVALLVWGDPFAATTHVMIRNVAEEEGTEWKYVPGVSILSVMPSLLGLQHYRFGKVVTIPKTWKDMPSFFERIERNREMGAHTLCLVDIGMNMDEALRALLFWSERRSTELGEIAGIARATWETQTIHVGTVGELLGEDWGNPPFSIVVPADMHPEEMEAWVAWKRRRKK